MGRGYLSGSHMPSPLRSTPRTTLETAVTAVFREGLAAKRSQIMSGLIEKLCEREQGFPMEMTDDADLFL